MPIKKIKLIFLDEAIKILNRKKNMKKILIFLIILLSLTSCEEFTIKTNNMTVTSIKKCDTNVGKKYKVEVECNITHNGSTYRRCFFYTDKEYRIGDTVMLE